jgi:hypothetical protein
MLYESRDVRFTVWGNPELYQLCAITPQTQKMQSPIGQVYLLIMPRELQ